MLLSYILSPLFYSSSQRPNSPSGRAQLQRIAHLAAASLQTVIQEARVFNETPISPRKCRILLTKIVYLLCVGETFGTQEATTLFFGVTKLFQHKDVSRYVLFVYR